MALTELPPAPYDCADIQGRFDEIAEQMVSLEGIDAHELTLTTCRFPLWGNDDPVNHRYCGRRIAAENATYCTQHRAVCVSPGTQRRTLAAKQDIRIG